MKVALYYPWIYLTGGAERVILGLLKHSRHHFELFTSHFEPENTFPDFRDFRVHRLKEVSVARNLGAVARAGLTIASQKLPLDGFDALVVVCDGLGDLVLFRNTSVPACCCCLTPLRVAFDEFYQERCLASTPRSFAIAHKLAASAFRAVDRLAWRRYQRSFFISKEVARRAVKGGLVEAENVHVVYPSLGISAVTPSHTFEPFFLIAGRIMWTKNIELGIAAFRRFVTQHPGFAGFRLVIAGKVDRKSAAYLAHLRSLAGDDARIEFQTCPSDADLYDLYQRCWSVLYPPFNEDWGIVPLEAMSFGKPVIAVNRGGPKESVEHGVHGFLVDPDPEQMASYMNVLASDPELARRMGSAGIERARLFTWEGFVRPMDNAIELMVAEAMDKATRQLPLANTRSAVRRIR